MSDLVGAERGQVPQTDVHKYVQYSQLHVACQADTMLTPYLVVVGGCFAKLGWGGLTICFCPPSSSNHQSHNEIRDVKGNTAGTRSVTGKAAEALVLPL